MPKNKHDLNFCSCIQGQNSAKREHALLQMNNSGMGNVLETSSRRFQWKQ